MKTKLLIFILFSFSLTIKAQTKIDYPHCNCSESIEYLQNNPTKKNGLYELICNNTTIEVGKYNDGLKDSLWIVKTRKGVTISKIEYSKGVISGKYELFDFDGKPILTAQFENGLPTGEWQYLNSKGKIIKTGNYLEGKPIGKWIIYDKKGKRPIVEYDFDKSEYLRNEPYIVKDNSRVIRDDQSGEFIILFNYKDGNYNLDQPIGGLRRTCDDFADYLNIPIFMMNTYTNYSFSANIKIENYVVKDIEVIYQEKYTYDKESFDIPFLVSTNFDKNLKRIKHSNENIESLKNRIFETLSIIGPWIPSKDNTIKLNIPIVLNDIKR